MHVTTEFADQSPVCSAAVETSVFPPVEAILPHRGTMLLIDAVLACTDEALTAEAHAHSEA